jgi:copper resistance protein C
MTRRSTGPTTRRVTAEAIAVALLVLVGWLACAAPARAHADQTGSSPAADSVLDTAPTRVEVTFGSPLLDAGAALVVRAADGTSITTGPPRVSRNRIEVAVAPDAPAGEYQVAYRVISQDGHTVSAAFRYTVAGEAATAGSPSPTIPAASPTIAAASPTATAGAAPDAEAGSGRLLLFGAVVAGAAAVLVGIAVALGRRERTTDRPGR